MAVCYTLHGPLPATKITLRCAHCRLNYRYDKYGSDGFGGYQYYKEKREYVCATRDRFVSRVCQALFAAAGHHAWMSFQASAEVYNELMRVTDNQNAKSFFTFLQTCVNAELDDADDDDDNHLSECVNVSELHRKTVASSFWNGELEDELRENGKDDYLFQNPSDREKAMDEIDAQRAVTVYKHEGCSEECKKRGCGKLYAIDGNWKLAYPICLFKVPKDVSGFNGKLSYVDACSNSPATGQAFCTHHCHIAQQKGVPTSLKEFYQYCCKGKTGTNGGPTKADVDKVLKVLCSGSNSGTAAAACQGTSDMIKTSNVLSADLDKGDEDAPTECNKETGEKRRQHKWTRGVWACVNGGGIIQMWQPLYQSEGPAQVFLLVLTWLVAAFGNQGRSVWQGLTLSYDNMCHLDGLRVARRPLPLPGDLKFIWSDINKIIDSLHIKNHRDKRCTEKYSPTDLKEDNPTFNTMSCEQTFAWFSRFKRIVNSLPKTHHHFFLHRMVKRRIEYCYANNRRPLATHLRGARVGQ